MTVAACQTTRTVLSVKSWLEPASIVVGRDTARERVSDESVGTGSLEGSSSRTGSTYRDGSGEGQTSVNGASWYDREASRFEQR